MDAVAEARTQINDTLKGWAVDGKTLLKTARELGIDTGPVLGTLTGSVPPASARPARARSGRQIRGPARRRSAPNGPAVTAEQILGFLRSSGPGNQSQLATRFHTSRQTIAKRLEALVDAGELVVQGQGSQKMWAVTALASAGQSTPAAA